VIAISFPKPILPKLLITFLQIRQSVVGLINLTRVGIACSFLIAIAPKFNAASRQIS
jgi:hypothetical protein